MRKEIHPSNFRPVLFRDQTAGESFVLKSTVKTEKTMVWTDGQEYPLCDLAISSYSHPFYTGSQRLIDTGGRIEKFQKRYARR